MIKMTTLFKYAGPAVACALAGWPRTAGAGLAEAASGVAAGLPHDLSPWGMFMAADAIVKSVMIGLALASVTTWSIWLAKGLELAAERRRLDRDRAALDRARSLAEALAVLAGTEGPGAALVQAAALEADMSGPCSVEGLKERVASRLERIEAGYGRRLALGTGILATIGSTAPFVGLFGTVWGIMNAFIGIARTQTTNLAVVAPGIAEALLATALGLVAAIPAVVAYNGFARAITLRKAILGDLAAEVLRLVSRDAERPALALAKAAE